MKLLTLWVVLTCVLLGLEARGEVCAGLEKQVPFADGLGDMSDPYLICSAAQLNRVRDFSSSHFVLGTDLDLSITGMNPISEFSGHFDGAGRTIRNWSYAGDFVDNQNLSAVGLVGRVRRGTIKNLRLENFKIVSERAHLGALAGVLENSTLEKIAVVNVSVRSLGDVNTNGAWSAGGMVGQAYGSLIERSFASGKLLDGGHAYATGGLIGGMENTTVKNSYSQLPVVGYWLVGGLTGGCGSGGCTLTIENSYTTSTVKQPLEGGGWGTFGPGGLVGNASTCNVKNSYYVKNTWPLSPCGAARSGKSLKLLETFVKWDFLGTWQLLTDQYPSLR